jgi:hypothetical protein
MDLGETPVGVGSNYTRNELRDAEGPKQGGGRALHEEKTVRTCDEDKGL